MLAQGEKMSGRDVDTLFLIPAERKAQSLHIYFSARAKEMIQNKVLPKLRRANEEGELFEKQDEVVGNADKFVQLLFDEQLHGNPGEITTDHISDLLSKFCQRFPDFFPFCP
jgi:hypothetical protein